MHGLEGDNEAQIAFFRSYGGHAKRSTVPKFRGLIWVACDDEEVSASQSYQSSPVYSDDDLDDDDFSSEIDCDDDRDVETFDMDIDTNHKVDPKDAEVHMHPVHHRANSVADSTAPVYAADYAYSGPHDRRASNASSFSASSIASPASTTFSASFTSDPSVSNQDGLSQHSPVPATPSPPPPMPPSLLTSSFHASELLVKGESGPELVRPRVPDGISLRNFGIQVPIFATLSDVVIYSPKGASRTAFALAEKFKLAIEAKMNERIARLRAEGEQDPEKNLIPYNVFVLTATLPEMLESLPHLLSRVQDVHIVTGKSQAASQSGSQDSNQGTLLLKANTINFAQREKEEMRDLTRATEIISTTSLPDQLSAKPPSVHWDPTVGQIFLGNANDVPIADEWVPSPRPTKAHYEDPFDFSSNDPALGYGFDICIECHDLASFPSSAHLRAADEHLAALDATWAGRNIKDEGDEIPIRPPPNANSVVHLPFPSSPPSTAAAVNALAPFVAFLDRWLRMPGAESESPTPGRKRGMTFSPSSLPPPTSFTNNFFSPSASGPYTRVRSTSTSYSSYGYPSSYHPRSQAAVRTRPMKILIYSSDGYTESSVLALTLLMAMRGLSLPQAYLELQVAKKRSFFVYQSDLGLLKRVEARLGKDRGSSGMNSSHYSNGSDAGSEVSWNPGRSNNANSMANTVGETIHAASTQDLTSSELQQNNPPARTYPEGFRRPRARTMPMMPAFTDHQSWFNDPRFNGSFPSRVLPFLYLGDLNHASNPYMLHALGITHVVSVGECALVPPPGYPPTSSSSTPEGACGNNGASCPPREHASLWIEEREGRIKVLDIQGVCDDGIDTLEPQLQPICDWIEKARLEGGQVLVHCRVGVSRSATVTIAYVMKHLGIPLVDAYLIVRSRRLSVLIQPNMRLLYNLLGWEVKLARERAGDDEDKLRAELARCLNWPYLAREVHALNEKYLH